MAENKFNNEETIARCVPMGRLQSVIGGKWKILILWYVSFYKVQRFGELMRRLDGITQSTLTKQLRELESDGFLHREIYAESGILTYRVWGELYPRPADHDGMERDIPLPRLAESV